MNLLHENFDHYLMDYLEKMLMIEPSHLDNIQHYNKIHLLLDKELSKQKNNRDDQFEEKEMTEIFHSVIHEYLTGQS